MEKYTFEGITYNVAPNRLEEFLQKHPNATKVDEPGKTTSSAGVTPTGGPNNTGLNSENGSSGYDGPETVGELASDIIGFDFAKPFVEKAKAAAEFFSLIMDDYEYETEETDREKGQYQNIKKAMEMAGYSGKYNPLVNLFAEGLSNMGRSAEGGSAQGAGTEEGFVVMNAAVDTDSDEELLQKAQGLIDVNNNNQGKEPTDNIKKYQERYEQLEEEHGGTMAWMVAVAENPMYIRDVSIQSLAMMGTALATSETIQRNSAVATTGAGMAGSFVPVVGTSLAAISGLFGSVSGQMDASLSYQQFLQEQLTEDGKDFTAENIVDLLQDDRIDTYEDPNGNTMLDITGTKADIIKQRSIRRGWAVGLTDGFTSILSGGVAKGSLAIGAKLTTKATKAMKGTATAVAGGLASEIFGQTAGGQEYDAGEILTEGFAEKGMVMTGVTVIPQLIKKKGSYTLNGEKLTEKKFVKEVNNMNDVTLAQASYKIENDGAMLNQLDLRSQNAVMESQIDAKVSDSKDRKTLVEKQKQLQKAEADAAKKGAYEVPGAELKVEKIKAEMKAIIDKYAGTDGRKKVVRDRAKIKELVARAQERILLEETEKFAESGGKKLDLNPYQAFTNTDKFVKGVVDHLMRQKQYLFDGVEVDITKLSDKKIAEEVQRIEESSRKGAGAAILTDTNGKDTIFINREAAVKYRQLDVGSHEILHKVLKGALTNMKPEAREILINEFKQEVEANLGSKALGLIEQQLDAYGSTINRKTSSEWFTALSDVIESKDNNITYDNSKGFFDSIKDKVANVFKKETEYENLSIKTGEQAFEFMKEYSQNVKKGELSERMVAFAKGQKIPPKDKKAGVEFSKTSTAEVNDLGKQIVDEDGTVTDLEKEGQGNAYFEAEAENIWKQIQKQGLLDGLILAQPHEGIDNKTFLDTTYTELFSWFKKYQPERKNPSGLFGHINPQIPNRAKQAYNAITKDEIKYTKEIGETTKEGEVKIQVAAEKSSEMEAFEQEDLSPAAQAKKKADKAKGKEKVESKFRKQLGIETGGDLYNKVLDTARKSLLRAYEAGTSVRNIQRKLRDEANVYLFKDIKNFLGTKEYIKRLKEFRVPIMNSIFTADLVQMERNTPESERVFTRFVRKLTSKADVQAAVDQNLLPVSALNIIDKGTAVSLYEKANPTEAQFMSYFDIPTINPKTGARSGTRGTRKDQLAKNMAGALSYDATMEVAQEPSTMQKRSDIAEIKGEVLPQDNLEVLAAAINRDVNVKFSKSINPSKLKNTTLYLQSIENKLADGNNVKPFFELTRTLVEEGLAIEDAVAIAKQSLPTQSNVLDLILNNGNFNTLHIDNIIWGINNFVLPKVRKLGHDTSVKYLEQQINGKSISNKVKLTNEYLANIGRPTRSAGVDGITTNQQLYDEVIVPLGLGDQYRLVDASIRGQKLQYKKGDKFIDVELYENIENIKNNAYKNSELVEKINNQAKQAKDYVFKILDSNLTEAEKKAVVQLMAYDQRGALRKVSKLGMTTKGLDASKTVLEHEFTIKDLQDKVNDYIDGKINKEQLEKIFDDGRVHVLPKSLDTILRKEKIGQRGGKDRYENGRFKKALNKLVESGVVIGVKLSKPQDIQTLNNAVKFSRSTNNPTKGITVLDFDDTLATSKSLIRFTRPDGTKGTLNAEQYASTYEKLTELGYKWDFSEFSKVVKGKTAPLFNKAIKLQGKFGPENMFILTARPADAAVAIHTFLKANGLNIPLKNITGLANSTAEAKALWIADKVGEGYNDFYFADDALQNVKAVKNMLNQLDVKSKVQQARVKFSKSMNEEFNDILENTTGIDSVKRFSEIKGRKRGDDKGKFRLFIPPSHEDFVGLLYNFMGKGKEGNKHRDFFEQALVRPINRAYREIDTAKQAIANDYKALNKKFPEIKDKLIKTTPDGDFTFSDAIRVYLWNKHGHKIPGLTETDQAQLTELVQSDPQLQAYAETLNIISKQETYVAPGQSWEMGNIRIDLVDATGRVGRAEYFSEFQENADVIFSEENLNKIEAAYGKDFRSALEDMLHRIKTGVNRPKGASAKPNMFMNWLNASVAGVMFFNTRSALLQQMSNVNYLNFADNNIYAAGKAFANQKQYWKDFAMIFNSDMMKQRRGGLGTDINGAELAEAIKKARPDSMFDQVAIITGKALKLGFLPTQIGDNIAIATGGSAFYRNRVNKYVNDGMSVKEAENAAFTDFQNITQSTQQSARPDMTSQQQASWIGKLVLNFLNTPSQYNRIIKKAGLDILNRRITGPNTSQMQSDMSNASRILYYGAAQNLIFYSLQTALFAVMFGDEEDEEAYLKKKERVINGSIDTILRGSGIYGVAVSTLKNMTIKFLEQREKGYNKDESAVLMEGLNFSPVLGIKARRIVNAEKTINYNGKVIEEMETFDLDNPQWSAVTNYTQSITGAPLNKMYQKVINLRNASDNQYTALQRILFLSGYTTWSLNLGDTKKMEKIKEKTKVKNKKSKKSKGPRIINL